MKRERGRGKGAFLLALSLLLFPLSHAGASETAARFFTFPSLSYDPDIPGPEGFLGYRLGERFTPHHRLIAYLEALGEASPRMELHPYGETYEGRKLVYAVVSSPANMDRIEELRRANLQLADPEAGLDESFYQRAPIFVWLSFNIHGDEASTAETAMAALYYLAAVQEADLVAMLDSVVVIVDPVLNPDGRERYVHNYQARLGRGPDSLPSSWEHIEPWPSGRYNHYLFDLNRDWSWLTQVESRQRVAAYLAWLPQVHVDFHEMYPNSSYFFFPATPPINPNYPLDQVDKWARRFGTANAASFDQRGWSYFAGEEFDLYYPGYGDSWPTFHGATGMTYEQAGHGRAGLSFRRKDSRVLTLAERIEHHFVAALTTITTAVHNREERLRDFRSFFRAGVGPVSRGSVRAYVVAAGDDPGRAAELVSLLLRHGVEVKRALEEVRASDAFDYRGGRQKKLKLPVGSYIIPLRQPLQSFVRSLMERETALPDTFFYDITAWSLPLAFGLPAYEVRGSIKGRAESVEEEPKIEGEILAGEARFGYLIPWQTNSAVQVLAGLLRGGIYLRCATKEFTLAGRRFGPGTIIVPRAGNPDTLPRFLGRLAQRTGVAVFPASTGLTEKGIDLGSNDARYLKPLRVAVAAGRGTSPTSLGAVWFMLDRVYEIPYSLVEAASLGQINLDSYGVLVLPDDEEEDGLGKGYESVLDSTAVAKVRDWIERGGVFVGLAGGAAFASADGAGLSSVKIKKRKEQEGRELLTVEQRRQAETRSKIPGAILRVKLDTGHPLAFGYCSEVMVPKTTRLVFEPIAKGYNVGYFPEGARVAGYVSAENERFLAGTPYLVEEKKGKGHIVLYLDDPNFRLFWQGLNRLFLNSIFFLSGS